MFSKNGTLHQCSEFERKTTTKRKRSVTVTQTIFIGVLGIQMNHFSPKDLGDILGTPKKVGREGSTRERCTDTRLFYYVPTLYPDTNPRSTVLPYGPSSVVEGTFVSTPNGPRFNCPILQEECLPPCVCLSWVVQDKVYKKDSKYRILLHGNYKGRKEQSY